MYMGTSEIKKKILEHMSKQKLTVISTIHADQSAPESACIGFTETENLEIVFGTSNQSRKYKNIQSNPNVAFVIGWTFGQPTVQYEGMARELTSEEAEGHSTVMAIKNKQSEKFRNRPDQRYFLVTPKWIRYYDTSTNDIQEITL